MIPTSIFNLSLLNVFNLADNQLQGSIPSDFGLTLPFLKKIQLSYNKFTGSIPISLSNASTLQVIDLQFNNFSGPISVDFGRFLDIQKIRLTDNNLGSGGQGHLTFLDTLINCSSLQILELGANNFQGSLPRSIANLSNELTMLSLADNRISGSIPSEVNKFINLIFLSLKGNKFTGIIPFEIVKLSKLQRLVLSSNRLTGNIPASIGNLSMLDELHLENNELNGNIPSSFGNCPMLVVLDLSRNKLSGAVPNKLFYKLPTLVKLNLSQNHLVGSLAGDIGALTHLVALDVSENKLSGLIPGNLGECVFLESLYMQGNFFQGNIPQWMRHLQSMQNIDLSRNNLSGNIPDFFETLSLKHSNLSWNILEGEVPKKGVFANSRAFSIVGNKGLCGGIPELQLPRCSSDRSHQHSDRSHQHKMAWIRILILIGCIQNLLVISYLCWPKRKGKEPRSESKRLMSVSLSPITLSYELLHQATNGFSETNLVSKGAFGAVYKGQLGPQYNETAVAIKVFSEEAADGFITESEALRNIHHGNIIKIMGTCSSIVENHEFKAIVFDFMGHGSLERWLHPTHITSYDRLNMPQVLNIGTIINIAIDVAGALNYLHNQSDNPLIHCNLKPSSIWLDTDMSAHLSNFAQAKFLAEIGSTNQSILTGLAGTPGYMPPEYNWGSMVSTKVDIYSYGITLLEMLTGKKTTDTMFHEGYTLHNFVISSWSGRVKDIIDPAYLYELEGDDAAQAEDCLSMLFIVGVECSLNLPQFRPDISDTLSVLETVRIVFKANTGSAEANANTSSYEMAQRIMKTQLFDGTKKMARNSRSMSTLASVTVSYLDLHVATNGFSITNLVGAGGFGSVYKGTFHQEYVRLLSRNSGIEDGIGTAVAIKVFNLQRRGAVRSFNTEYKTLRNIHHLNFVKIITTCTSVDQEGHDFRAILYEFMDHGSLAMWLHPTNKTFHNGAIKPQILSLHARIDIAIDVACALNYIHHQCENSIIHCDLKPSNILLDKNMVARVADFGLAISLTESPNLNQRSNLSGLRGTTGYIAPEYGLGCKMTTKGDTYSFGILLLEMLTRMRPTHLMFRGGLNLHNFVWMSFPDNVIDITDPLMKAITSVGGGKGLEERLTRMYSIGLACSKPSPNDRPGMHAVLLELLSIRNSL